VTAHAKYHNHNAIDKAAARAETLGLTH